MKKIAVEKRCEYLITDDAIANQGEQAALERF